jgi:hypothetical protein
MVRCGRAQRHRAPSEGLGRDVNEREKVVSVRTVSPFDQLQPGNLPAMNCAARGYGPAAETLWAGWEYHEPRAVG